MSRSFYYSFSFSKQRGIGMSFHQTEGTLIFTSFPEVTDEQLINVIKHNIARKIHDKNCIIQHLLVLPTNSQSMQRIEETDDIVKGLIDQCTIFHNL